MGKTEWGIISFIILIAALVVTITFTTLKYNTYYIKDVEVVDKETYVNLSTTDYPNFFIIIEKDGKKAKLEVDKEDYRRIIKGQHINASIKKSSAYVRRYQLVMD